MTYTQNRGAAFGIMQNQRWFFLIITAAVCAVVVYLLFIRKPVVARMPGVPVAFLLGGAIGNLIDRAVFGYVVDVFDARIISFAVFNVADSCLVCAVIVLVIWMIYEEYRKKKAGAEKPHAEP